MNKLLYCDNEEESRQNTPKEPQGNDSHGTRGSFNGTTKCEDKEGSLIQSPREPSQVETKSIEPSDNRSSTRTDSIISFLRESLKSRNRSSSGLGKPPSLTNIGANCYLNSAFQGISACDLFVTEIDELRMRYKNGSLNKLDLFKQLMDILNGCSTHQMNISRNPIFCNWNKPGQQEIYELLAYALNQVYNELRAYLERQGIIPVRDLNRWLNEELPMRCILIYKLSCECSMVTYSPLQSDLALHVTVPNKNGTYNLGEQIDQYFSDDLIEDFVCDNQECKNNKGRRLARLRNPVPKTICIHLQRTFWNGRRMVKINNEVTFDIILRIKAKYIDIPEENRSRNGDTSKDSVSIEIAEEATESILNMPGNSNATENDYATKMLTEMEKSSTNINLDQHKSINDYKVNLDLSADTKYLERDSKKVFENEKKLTSYNVTAQQSCNSDNNVNDKVPDDVESLENYINFKNMNSDEDNIEHGSPRNNKVDSKVSDVTQSFNNDIKNIASDYDSDDHSSISDYNLNHEGRGGTKSLENCSTILSHSEKAVLPNEMDAHRLNEKNMDPGSSGVLEDKESPLTQVSKDLDYRLVSVIVHSGSVDGGHYVCYKRVCDKWFLTNDSYVCEVKESSVLKSQAYILFYEQL